MKKKNEVVLLSRFRDDVFAQFRSLCFGLSCVVFIRMFPICNNKPEHVESVLDDFFFIFRPPAVRWLRECCICTVYANDPRRTGKRINKIKAPGTFPKMLFFDLEPSSTIYLDKFLFFLSFAVYHQSNCRY